MSRRAQIFSMSSSIEFEKRTSLGTERLCKLLIFKHYTKSSFLYPSDLVTFWSLFSLSHCTDALGLFVLYQYDARETDKLEFI